LAAGVALTLEVASMLLVMWVVAPVGCRQAYLGAHADLPPGQFHARGSEKDHRWSCPATADLLPTEIAIHECID